MFRSFLIDNFPRLGQFKRYLRAIRSHYRKTEASYSQHQEDKLFLQELSKKGLNSGNSMYIDVGANHPSDLSNTYLLYRHGMQGILIEANDELCKLNMKFRPRDIVFNIGASDKASVMDFHISKTPVLSTFNKNDTHHDRRLYRTLRVPLMRVDDAVSCTLKGVVSLLSIDVESLNLEVLRGSIGLLEKTYLICIEYDTEADRSEYLRMLQGKSFDLIDDNGCNVIFKNSNLIC